MSDNITPLCPHGELEIDCRNCSQDYTRERPPLPKMSEPDDRLDDMIAAASLPSLATLIKRGKEAGLIQPVTGYAGQDAGA